MQEHMIERRYLCPLCSGSGLGRTCTVTQRTDGGWDSSYQPCYRCGGAGYVVERVVLLPLIGQEVEHA